MPTDHAHAPAPGNFWWEYEITCALREGDADRIDYLVRLADAYEARA